MPGYKTNVKTKNLYAKKLNEEKDIVCLDQHFKYCKPCGAPGTYVNEICVVILDFIFM